MASTITSEEIVACAKKLKPIRDDDDIDELKEVDESTLTSGDFPGKTHSSSQFHEFNYRHIDHPFLAPWQDTTKIVNEWFTNTRGIVLESPHTTHKKQCIVWQLYRQLKENPNISILWLSPDHVSAHRSQRICQEFGIHSTFKGISNPSQAPEDGSSDSSEREITRSSAAEQDEFNTLDATIWFATPTDLKNSQLPGWAKCMRRKFDIVVFDLVDRILTELNQSNIGDFAQFGENIKTLCVDTKRVWAFDWFTNHGTILESIYQLTGVRCVHYKNTHRPVICKAMQYKPQSDKPQMFTLTSWYNLIKAKLKEGKSVSILMDERRKQGNHLSYKTIQAPFKNKYRKYVKVYEMGRHTDAYEDDTSDYLFCVGQNERDWKRFEQEAHRFDKIQNYQVYLVFIGK